MEAAQFAHLDTFVMGQPLILNARLTVLAAALPILAVFVQLLSSPVMATVKPVLLGSILMALCPALLALQIVRHAFQDLNVEYVQITIL